MKKYIKFILIVLFANQGYSQIDEIRVNLLRAKNQTIEMDKNYKLNVQIYPELPRFGEFRLLDINNKVIYSDFYSDVDFIIIDFNELAKKIKKGKYLLQFKAVSENSEVDSENAEEEIITLKLK